MTTAKPKFFRTAKAFGEWLDANHDRASELLVGFYKKASGKPSITYQEALDEALAIGWIDGVRRTIDEESYMIRFTPRKPKSIWSNVNIKRVSELTAAGRMKPPGLAAFERRDPARSGVYSFEREHAQFAPEELAQLRADRRAFEFFERQPPSYRRVATFWVTSAKRSETRARRLASLIECSRQGERIKPLARPAKAK